MERRHIIYKDLEFNLHGEIVQVGTVGPEFDLVAYDRGDTKFDHITRDSIMQLNYPVLISVISSLDTPVGKIQTIKFNEKLLPYVDNAILMCVSSDLPFTTNRFFDEHMIDRLLGCSDYNDRSFGKNWGLLIEEPEILTRAVIVLDKDFTVQYIEVVEVITNEPNYDDAIEVLDRLVNGVDLDNESLDQDR